MTSLATDAPVQARPFTLRPWLFAVAVFTSASLVFLVQPLVGKLFLPMLGGSPAIWNTTLAFFQAALLVGYGYAHFLQKAGPVRRQIAIHLVVLAVAALTLPIRPSQLLGLPWQGAPAIWLALVLALTIGAPFAVLSATAPLLQAWYARLGGGSQGRDAYALYAASNLGSLLALAAYPALVEPLIGLRAQAIAWSLAYGGFALLLVGLGGRIWRLPEQALPTVAATRGASWRERLIWIALAAAPSSLLVGVTAHVTADVASAPFLWVIPLQLYLVTFVIAFRSKAGPVGEALRILQIVGVAAALLALADPNVPWLQQLFAHLGAFFVVALVCHKTLAERRPDAARLTEFYLCLSVGGVVGGAFNAFLAPVLFDGVWEYPAVLALSCLALPWGGRKRWQGREVGYLLMGVVWATPLLIPSLNLPGFLRIALELAPVAMAIMLRHRALAVAILLAVVGLAAEAQGYGRYQAHHRSFFGVTHLNVVHPSELGPARIMVHGTTLHGVQALDPALRCRPTAYYAPNTVIGTVFRTEQAAKPALSMGAVGLGVGTVSSFVRPSDRMRFYEIDPEVVRISWDPANFSFVKACAKGPVDVVVGDARLSLAKEPDAAFDLVLVDAFSSDSVPTHLLTVEAMRGYLRLLKPVGVVLLHLSNRNLSLGGPAAAAAKAVGGSALRGEHWKDPSISDYAETGGIVLLVARDAKSLERYRNNPEWTVPASGERAWTDDYTNVWGAMLTQWRLR